MRVASAIRLTPREIPTDRAQVLGPVRHLDPSGRAEQSPASATVAVPRDPATWTAMAGADLEAVGRRVAEITPGFRFGRIERSSGAGLPSAIAVLVHEMTELEFSLIPPGNFMMGSPGTEQTRREDEGPLHRVTIPRAFLICRTECTERAWMRDTGRTPPTRASEAGEPIVDVAWTDVTAWCDELGLRLPSEAEWEYACRARSTTAYWAGEAPSDLAELGWSGTHNGVRLGISRGRANAFGLIDVHTSVWEWCEDRWHHTHEGAPIDGSPRSDGDDAHRVIRGGGLGSPEQPTRSARRSLGGKGITRDFIGFRPAATVGGE